MPKPNTQFNLSVKDIELIENALRFYKIKPKEVQMLLAKIHDQKEWYNPGGLK